MRWKRRKRRPVARKPELSVAQILAWADASHQRTGQWPNLRHGPIAGSLGETWRNVDAALRIGLRGLPGRSSLPRLLAEHRGTRKPSIPPPLSVQQILEWADASQQSTGQWPRINDGRIAGSSRETWEIVDVALREGFRGLPGGSSLPRLLAECRGTRNKSMLPPLPVEQILAWADGHYRRWKEWPTQFSGRIADCPEERWSTVNSALHNGCRGLPGGSSLAQMLASHRGVRNRMALPELTVKQILEWADAFHKRTGRWPRMRDGPITDCPGETWRAADAALRTGIRGLPEDSSLARLLAKHRGKRNPMDLKPFTIGRILDWAGRHFRKFKKWPDRSSGPIADAPGETWQIVDQALKHGGRGLPGGSSLAHVLAARRGRRNHAPLPH